MYCNVLYYNQLTREQRYAIYLGKTEKKTNKAIAQQIGVHPSTISRELKRNISTKGSYLWFKADERALSRKNRNPVIEL
ncbi:MAG: helix-turn-helix domain-containing protein [Bacteroidaceae bacterium]